MSTSTKQIYARVTRAEKVAIEQAAESLGLSLSDFVRQTTIPQAYSVLKKQRERQNTPVQR